jgi:anti-sigma factor (TIGR02949 family)
MDCAEAKEQFSSLLDGELAPEDRTALERHLAGCSDCLRELDGLKKVEGLFRELPRHEAPAGFEARVRDAVRPKVFRFARARAQRMSLWPMLSAAAAFVMVAGLVLWQVQFVAGPSRFQVAKTDVADKEAVSPLSEAKTEADLDVAGPTGEQVGGAAGDAEGWGLLAEGQSKIREEAIPEERQTFADDSFGLEPGDTSTAYRAAAPEVHGQDEARTALSTSIAP